MFTSHARGLPNFGKLKNLWFTSHARGLPNFPLKKQDVYKVGLLWKSDKRPEDNGGQARTSTEKLVKWLERREQREQHEDVLLRVHWANGL